MELVGYDCRFMCVTCKRRQHTSIQNGSTWDCNAGFLKTALAMQANMHAKEEMLVTGVWLATNVPCKFSCLQITFHPFSEVVRVQGFVRFSPWGFSATRGTFSALGFCAMLSSPVTMNSGRWTAGISPETIASCFRNHRFRNSNNKTTRGDNTMNQWYHRHTYVYINICIIHANTM